MSNVDNFIDEVTEEVRREQLLRMMRRYGWIAILLAVMIVVGAATNEFLKAQERARAQALGDAMLNAVESSQDPAERAEALAAIAAEGDAKAVVDLQAAAARLNAEQPGEATGLLESIAKGGSAGLLYQQLAQFKALLIATDMPAAERRAGFEALATPGAPFRLLAEEQIALIEAETGDTEAAIIRLQALLEDNEASAGLRRRASQLIVALGGELSAA
ncbi:hypothetical protein PSA7680_00903 [Pseudoruegeria aquimaris]|uniref:Tetratricopeptide repeat-like domain-containing protein n=1 Tax=Pseudoruegeria aquimaris TaxID=393663 RepID=A0A1Y5RTU9_9RHOB|nr:hypothetical protein [Pseudoruegeria aquimaris]SLN22633.1 hypothetical protein PSA7680_00903 [Pseudoruegeria aquimaris]